MRRRTLCVSEKESVPLPPGPGAIGPQRFRCPDPALLVSPSAASRGRNRALRSGRHGCLDCWGPRSPTIPDPRVSLVLVLRLGEDWSPGVPRLNVPLVTSGVGQVRCSPRARCSPRGGTVTDVRGTRGRGGSRTGVPGTPLRASVRPVSCPTLPVRSLRTLLPDRLLSVSGRPHTRRR